MVRDGFVIPVTRDSSHNVNVASEHLIKVVALAMCLSASPEGASKIAAGQSLSHHRDVVVEVATYNDWRMRVLLGDIPGDINDPLRSVLQLRLLPRLQVAIKHLDYMCPNLQLSPAEVCPYGLHHGQLGVGERCCPYATVPLSTRLE